MQYMVGVWGQWSRVSMSVRSEVGWQERCDMPRGCCENGEEAEPRSGGGRALGAEEGASGGDQQMRLTSLSSLMEGIKVADGLRTVVNG